MVGNPFDVFSESVRVIPSVTLDSRDVGESGFEVTQKAGNHTHIFAPFVTLAGEFTDIMLFLPKAKTHFQMLPYLFSCLIASPVAYGLAMAMALGHGHGHGHGPLAIGHDHGPWPWPWAREKVIASKPWTDFGAGL